MRTGSENITKKFPIATLTAISLTCILSFATLIIVLHFLRPDTDPIHRPTSEYAVGKYGYLMTAAFFCMSVATFALVMSLNSAVDRKAKSVIGLVLLIAWAITVWVALIFPIDPEGAAATTAGKIHKTNGPIAFLCLTLGVLFVSSKFKHDENMRLLHPTALILSLILIILFIAVGASFGMGLGYEGILQRIYLIVVVTWFVLTIFRIRKGAEKIFSV